MIVRRLEDLTGTEREVDDGNWVSRRFILKDDGMGFSFHDTVIRAGTETRMWYKHHVEAVYCVAGEGEVETVDDGRVYPLRPGTLYALDGHERHKLRARTELHLVCAFCPPCTGREVHDGDGAYPLVESPS